MEIVQNYFILYPLFTKSIIAALLITIFDLVTQKFETLWVESKKGQDIDISRTVRIVVFFSLLGVPVMHFYYLLLEIIFPGTDITYIISKMIVDLFLFTPITIFAFFVGMGLMEGSSFLRIQQQLKNNYWSSIKKSFIVFPIASFINFFFVPVDFRLFFIGAVSLFWNGYLSYIKHNDEVHGVVSTLKPPTSIKDESRHKDSNKNEHLNVIEDEEQLNMNEEAIELSEQLHSIQ